MKRGENENSKSFLKLYWTKPNGGDAIDLYNVSWSPSTDKTNSKTVLHNRKNIEYEIEIDNLNPGNNYSITVTVINDQGKAQSYPTVIQTGKQLRYFRKSLNQEKIMN